jgi:hypothetical protein
MRGEGGCAYLVLNAGGASVGHVDRQRGEAAFRVDGERLAELILILDDLWVKFCKYATLKTTYLHVNNFPSSSSDSSDKLLSLRLVLFHLPFHRYSISIGRGLKAQ